MGYTKTILLYVTFVTIFTMLKNINIRDIPEELYYDIVELKGKLRAKNWADFLRHVNRIVREMKNDLE